MEALELAIETRVGDGKGGARKLRAAGRVPAVVYGKGFNAISISFVPSDLRAMFKSKLGRNTVLRLNVPNEAPMLAMLKEVQTHPVSREFIHVDFLRVYEDAEVVVPVPLHLEGRAEGVVAGGTLKQLQRTLAVRCLPKDIPTEVRADITPMQIGGSLFVRDIKLPAGCKTATDLAQPIATIEK